MRKIKKEFVATNFQYKMNVPDDLFEGLDALKEALSKNPSGVAGGKKVKVLLPGQVPEVKEELEILYNRIDMKQLEEEIYEMKAKISTTHGITEMLARLRREEPELSSVLSGYLRDIDDQTPEHLKGLINVSDAVLDKLNSIGVKEGLEAGLAGGDVELYDVMDSVWRGLDVVPGNTPTEVFENYRELVSSSHPMLKDFASKIPKLPLPAKLDEY